MPKAEIADANLASLGVRLLGPFTITKPDGEEIELPRKVRALFAYLVMRRGTAVPRQTLLGLFWGDRAEEQARSSLRQALNVLRTALDDLADGVVVSTKEMVSVVSESIRTDLEMHDHPGDGKDTGSGPSSFEFLEGLSLGDAGFEDWLREERERVRSQLIAQQKGLAHAEAEAGRHDAAAARLYAVLRQAPVDEDAHRQLMELHILRARTDDAIHQYELCRDLLREHLGVEPEPATRAIWERAKSLRRGAGGAPGSSSEPARQAAPFFVAMAAPPQADPVFRSMVAEYGGTTIEDRNLLALAAFDDTAAALRLCGDLRRRIRETSAADEAGVAFALTYCEPAEPGATAGARDLRRLSDLLEATQPGDTYVSAEFFNRARRNSPYFFDDLSQTGDPKLEGVLRVGRPMHRQPFLAVYNNPTPRLEKRPCSLAVAPIKPVGPDDDSTYWADGLTEDLILELSRTRKVTVSSRTTLFAIRTHDAVEIGRELGVGYVLSGSFRQLGSSARLNFSLAETESGNVVWSERFTTEFSQILDLVDEIVAKVVARIAGKIEHSEIEAARIKRPDNMNAYEYYLRGIWHHRLGGVTEEHSRKAVAWFQKAVEADPSFHRPYAMMVCAMSDLPDFDGDYADRIAFEAYAADPGDPELNRIMAWVKFTRGEYDEGIRMADASTELAPHDAYLLGRCAVLHIFNGDPDGGLALLARATELDPFVPVYIVEEFLTAFYAMGDYEKVVSEARTLHHQTRRSRYYTAASLVALGKIEAARNIVNAMMTDDPSLSIAYVRGQELYRDKALMKTLVARLITAGVPE